MPTRAAPLLLLCTLVATLVTGTTLRAQTVRWDPPGGQLGFNQVSELSLSFENCEPDADNLRLPQVDGLVFGRPSTSSQTEMVNFKVTRRFSFTYPVRPTRRATIAIPAFDVPTDKGPVRVAAATYTVGDATVGNTGVALDDISSVKITIPKVTVWAGEVFPVTYTLSMVKRYFHSLASAVDWQPAPLVIEEWSKPEPSETMLRGERRLVATQTTRGYVKQPGNFMIKPASQIVNMQVGTSGFGFFSSPSLEQRVLTTEPIEVAVRPLPSGPADFSGAVGQFGLVSKVVPTAPAVGEPVTWTLELAGTGNWPDIAGLPQREVSNDFQVVQPKSKRAMKDNSLFEGTLSEDVVLVPAKPGRYTLGPVKFTYFDTASGTYKTITTEPVTVNVGPGVAPIQTATPTGPVQFSLNLPSGSTQPAAQVAPTAVPPVPPENLPRDPLPGPGRSFAPFNTGGLWLAATLPATALVLLVWGWLAAARSRAHDPQRRRREARAALVSLLAEIRASGVPSSALSAQLRLWQDHATALWEIPHAAPGAPLVHGRVTIFSKDAAPVWAALWTEADRTLHGRDGALPKDWLSRAENALQTVKVPGWPPFSLFAPRHLLPFLFTLALLLVPGTLRADGAGDAYKRSEFGVAEAAWRTTVANAPADWTARHNLGLALAQQDRWAEATAHWTSGFVLNPRHETTRWDLALGLQRSGMAPPELVEFSRGEGRYELARAASPAEWQLVLVAASLLIAAALIVLLLKGYKKIGGWARPTALGAILVAILLAAAATFSLRTYGQLADPAAVIVWKPSLLRSIPTEADTAQKTSPLSAGSIAVADKTFLGWTRLNFTGGQTGWVRNEDVISLYR
ncbi:MAG: protein BatD [Opitutae bacterium]|nr:protein BatD [Opitutae bacterium]